MRITNGILYRESLGNLQRNLRDIQEAQSQVASGTRIGTISDSPADAGAVLGADRQLRALDQYRANIDSARSRLSVEESVLDQLGNTLIRAKEIAMAQAGSNATAGTRATAGAEAARLREMAVHLGNTRFEGAYLFGGNFADDAPFAADFSASATRPPVGEHDVEIGPGHLVRANHDGTEVFLDTGVRDALVAIETALAANDPAAITSAIGDLDEAFAAVQQLLGDAGARGNQLEVAESNVEALDANLRIFRSDLSDVELEEAVTRLLNRQTAFQAALMTTSRILETTLTHYLR